MTVYLPRRHMLRIDARSLLRYHCQVRSYARVIAGILREPKFSAAGDKLCQDGTKTFGTGLAGTSDPNNKSNELGAVVSAQQAREPQVKIHAGFHTVQEPPRISLDNDLRKELQNKIHTRNDMQQSPSLQTLLEEMNNKINAEIPHVLRNGNAGSPEQSLDEIADSVVTIAHVLPETGLRHGEIIVASGFAILDGSLVVTCAHTFYQMRTSCQPKDPIHYAANIKLARTVVITSKGEMIDVLGLESHLIMSDIVLLRIGKSLKPLKVNPYPCPTGNPVQVFNLHSTSLREGVPSRRHSWEDSEITLYQDRAGQEAATGSYDELNTLLFDTIPTPGSSGGPILDRENKSVIGVVRGSEVSYAIRKERGFATPAESLFNVFKLEM